MTTAALASRIEEDDAQVLYAHLSRAGRFIQRRVSHQRGHGLDVPLQHRPKPEAPGDDRGSDDGDLASRDGERDRRRPRLDRRIPLEQREQCVNPVPAVHTEPPVGTFPAA